jgi:hypothetical protein
MITSAGDRVCANTLSIASARNCPAMSYLLRVDTETHIRPHGWSPPVFIAELAVRVYYRERLCAKASQVCLFFL